MKTHASALWKMYSSVHPVILIFWWKISYFAIELYLQCGIVLMKWISIMLSSIVWLIILLFNSILVKQSFSLFIFLSGSSHYFH